MDMAVYTRDRFRRFPHFLLLFAYPLFVLGFAFEPTFLLGRRLEEVTHSPYRDVFLWLAVILGTIAFAQIIKLFWRRILMISESLKLRREENSEDPLHSAEPPNDAL